jgi:hypothetical protein
MAFPKTRFGFSGSQEKPFVKPISPESEGRFVLTLLW